MAKCHLHLGTNQGDRMVNLARAIQYIEVEIGEIQATSSIYETQAWGISNQPDFLNMAMIVEHYMNPSELLQRVNGIEDKMGRVRKEKWGPRLIDIDIIFMEDLVIQTKKLTIPHEHMEKRNFVLHPICEISPNMKHPLLLKTVSELKISCPDETIVRKLNLEELN